MISIIPYQLGWRQTCVWRLGGVVYTMGAALVLHVAAVPHHPLLYRILYSYHLRIVLVPSAAPADPVLPREAAGRHCMNDTVMMSYSCPSCNKNTVNFKHTY